MNARVRYSAAAPAEPPGPLARVFRALILLGVWILVGLAGLAAYAHLA